MEYHVRVGGRRHSETERQRITAEYGEGGGEDEEERGLLKSFRKWQRA